MQGDKQVLTLLNDVLTAELTAVNQYFLHARLCHHWGYDRLYEKRYAKVNVGQTVPEQFQLDLQVEYEAVKRLNDGIEACRGAGDNGTRELLERILVEEEEHVDWLETQQETIKQIGAERYLSEQLK